MAKKQHKVKSFHQVFLFVPKRIYPPAPLPVPYGWRREAFLIIFRWKIVLRNRGAKESLAIVWKKMGPPTACVVGGMTMIQLGEFAVANLLWIGAALSFLYVINHQRPQPNEIKLGHLQRLAAIGCVGVCLFFFVSFTNAKRGDMPWSNFLSPISAEMGPIFVASSPSMRTNFLLLVDSKLYYSNIELYIRLRSTQMPSAEIRGVSVDIHCDNVWTKLYRAPWHKGEEMVLGSGPYAGVFEFDDLLEKLAREPLLPGQTVQGMIFAEYPKNFVCNDVHKAKFRLILTERNNKRTVVPLSSATTQQDDIANFASATFTMNRYFDTTGMPELDYR